MLVENPNEKAESFNSQQDANFTEQRQSLAIPQLASRFKRWLAATINGLLFYAVYTLVFFIGAMLIRNINLDSLGETEMDLIVFSLFFISIVPYLLLQSLLIYRSGQTLGKKLLSLKVVDYGYQPLSFGRYVLREVLDMVFSFLTFPILISAIVAFCNQDRQSLTDKIMGTLVVKTK